MALCKKHPLTTDHIEKIAGLVNKQIDLVTEQKTEPTQRRKELAEWFELAGIIEAMQADAAKGGEEEEVKEPATSAATPRPPRATGPRSGESKPAATPPA